MTWHSSKRKIDNAKLDNILEGSHHFRSQLQTRTKTEFEFRDWLRTCWKHKKLQIYWSLKDLPCRQIAWRSLMKKKKQIWKQLTETHKEHLWYREIFWRSLCANFLKEPSNDKLHEIHSMNWHKTLASYSKVASEMVQLVLQNRRHNQHPWNRKSLTRFLYAANFFRMSSTRDSQQSAQFSLLYDRPAN